MGVKDLWKILKPTARPVSPETLQGMILGVDVSIWLNQAIKGMRDRHGNEIPNAHLLVLFNRICKLLHYQIKPVFVFDGPAPSLKLQTLAERRRRKQKASSETSSLLGKRALKMLEVHALQTVTGQEMTVKIPKSLDNQKDDDIFQLPEATTENKEGSPVIEETEDTSFSNPLYELFRNESDSIDINSETFLALPPEVQHDLLLEKKELQKHSYANPEVLPKKADDFSNYQLTRLKNRNNITRKLDSVRKSLNATQSASYGIPEGKECDIEARRIESSEGRHYILIKGKGIASSHEERDDFLTMDFRGRGVEDIPQLSQEEMSMSNDNHDLSKYDISRISSSSSPSTVNENEQDRIIESMTISEDEEVSIQQDTDPMTVTIAQDAGSLKVWDKKASSVANKIDGARNISSDNVNRSSLDEVQVIKETIHTRTDNTLTSIDTQNNTVVSGRSLDDVEISFDPTTITSSIANPDPCVLVDSQSPQTTSENPNTLHSRPIEQPQSDNSIPILLRAEGDLLESIHLPHPVTVSISSDSDCFSDVESIEVTQEDVSYLVPTLVDADYAASVLQEAKNFMNQPREEIEEVLVEQVMELDRRTVQQARQSAGVTNVMYKEAQELLKLFGLPYIESPSEAEAQCATLENLSLTHGTITEDNDVFLFGGHKVYRNVFSPNDDIEMFLHTDISSLLGLNRDKLIVLAYFLGSDYTNGLEGIGCVNAMELLDRYSGEGLEPLIKIRERNMEAKVKPGLQINETALQKKVRLLNLPHNFPNESIREAYISPHVDESSESFEWGRPDLDLLRQFTVNKFGWPQKQCDNTLLPVIRRINANQPLVTSYSVPKPLVDPSQQSGLFVKSKRLRNAVVRLTGQTENKQIVKQPETKRERGKTIRRGGRKGSRGNCNNQSSDSRTNITPESSPQSKKRHITSSSSSSSSSSDNES